jgi:ribosomal protein L17
MQTLKIEQPSGNGENRKQRQQKIVVVIRGQEEKAENVQQAIEKLITYIQQQEVKPGSLTIRIMRRKPLRTKNIVFVCDPINSIHHDYIKDALRELGYAPLFENHRGITFVLSTRYVSLQELIESETN